MKFRTTMLLAALLATAGCGGDDDDSSGLLSPTAPSPVTGVAAQNDSGRQSDPQVDGTGLIDGMRAAMAPATTIDFSSVTWSWNSAETHLEPSSIPDSRVQAGSNVWQRDDDTGLIRIFSDEDLSGWAFVTAGSSWSLSMRRPGLYVSNISAADVELIASGSGGSGGSGPRGEPTTIDFSSVTWSWNSAETHLEPSSIPDSRVQAGSNVWQRDDDTGLIRIFSDEDLGGWAFVTAGSSWSLSMRRPGLYVSNISAADVELIASGSGGSGGSGPRGEPGNEPGNRPRAACTLVYNYHDSSAYDGPLGHYVYATDGAGYTPSTAQAGYIGAFIHLDLSGDCSGGSSADRTALYSLAKPNSFSYLRYDHYAEWSPGGSGSWLQNVEDYGAIQGRHYYIIERSGDGELVDPVTKMWVRVILFGTNGGTQKRGRMGWAGSAAGMPDITITWNGLDSFLIPPRPPRPTPRVECVEGCIVQQGDELELRLVLDEPLIPGLPKLLRPRFDPPTIFREVTGRTQRDNWRECGIGQTDRAECLWRVKQTSGPGSLLGGSSYSFLWEAPRDPGSHKIKIGYEYKAWGSFKQWGYRDTAFVDTELTVTVPPPRADRGPVTTPLVCAPLIPPDTGWPCSVKINAEDEIPSRKRDLAIAEFMITAHDPEGDPIAYRWETHDRGVQTVTSLTPAEILELDPSRNSTSGSKLSWNMQGLDPRIYPVTVRVLDTPYRLGTGITATLHVENFVPNAAPAISLICAPRFQPQSGASNPCTATLDTPAIGSDGARIDFGAVVTDPENDSFTVAWTASAGSLSTSSGTNTTWNGSTLTAESIGHGDGHRHRQRRRGIHRHRHRARAGLRLGRRYRPDDTGATSASPGRWRLRSSRSDQDRVPARRAVLRAASQPDRGMDALRPCTEVDGRYGREWNPGVHFVQPDLRLHRLVPRN